MKKEVMEAINVQYFSHPSALINRLHSSFSFILLPLSSLPHPIPFIRRRRGPSGRHERDGDGMRREGTRILTKNPGNSAILMSIFSSLSWPFRALPTFGTGTGPGSSLPAFILSLRSFTKPYGLNRRYAVR